MKEGCKLCNAQNFKDILTFSQCFFSDGSKGCGNLTKEECQSCGTIRTKFKMDLEEFYLNNYQPSRNIDTIALANNEEVNRSKFVHDWIKDLIPKHTFKEFRSVFEIGCGQGYLIDKFEIENKSGIEPSYEASKIASKITNVRNIGYEQIKNNEKYDFTFSYCVIEHVENPSLFIKKSHAILNEEGILCVALPIQDKFNYDLVFADHIHHFHHENFINLLNSNKFEVIGFDLGRESYFNIGMYICRKKVSKCFDKFKYIKNENINNVEKIFNNIEKTLRKFKGEKIFAFGCGEIAKTILPYSNLGSLISHYIDDYVNNDKTITINDSKLLFENMDEVNMLLLVNPFHSNKIKKIYEEFGNIKFIYIFENIEI